MPKNKVNDLITDQEMTFAHLVLSGTMTDRQAAEAAGLKPDSAAYTKAKPRMRAYMAEHRAALRERLVAEESEGLRKLNVGRDKLLAHLWYLATLPPEVTRGNISVQLKATAMFASFAGLFPEASAARPEQPSAKVPIKAHIYESAWRRKQREEAEKSNPTLAQQQEEPAVPSAEPAPGSAQDSDLNSALPPGPVSDTSQPAAAHIPTFAERASSPYSSFVPDTTSVRDTRLPFSIHKTRFGNRR